jgi:hypothetical protein
MQNSKTPDADFTAALIEASRSGKSWRERLQRVCDRKTGAASLLACANFSFALRPALPSADSGLQREPLDYSRIPLSSDPAAHESLGKRLAHIAGFLEEKLGQPQDVEGACVGQEIYVVQARPQQGLRPETLPS